MKNWMLGVLAVVALMGAVVEVRAEGFTIKGYGQDASRDVCMQRAELALRQYGREYNMDSTGKLNWAMIGYDMNAQGDDVVLLCPVVAGNVELLLTIYGDTEDSRDLVIFRLDEFLERE